MPELWLLGFRGATRASYRVFATTDPLLYTGHVGISLDRGTTIYGFSPLAPGALPREIIGRLRRGDFFPGIVRDDRSVFERAVAAADQGLIGSPVYVWAQSYDTPRFEQIQARLQTELRHRTDQDGYYGWSVAREGVYNCATWPRRLGVALPEETGQLADYIVALRHIAGGRRWVP